MPKSLSKEKIMGLLIPKPGMKQAYCEYHRVKSMRRMWGKLTQAEREELESTLKALENTLGIERRGQYKLLKNAEIVIDMEDMHIYRLNLAQTTKTLICFDDGDDKLWEDDLLDKYKPKGGSGGDKPKIKRPPKPPKGKLGCNALKILGGAGG